jgi:hypothetical protein
MTELRDFTGEMDRAASFIRAKAELVDARGLSVHLKHTRARRRDVTGYYRFADRRIVIAVKKRLRYPRRAAYGIGSTPVRRLRLGGRPYKLVWFEEAFTSPEDLAIFVAGHEFWHFLCHTGQRRGGFEVRCNCNGFLWLAEFKTWAGGPVAAVPPRPPRPDEIDPARVPGVDKGQGELFAGWF